MPRRSTSSLWPSPDRWGQRRYLPRWRVLNWNCDQQTWVPKSAGIIGGRKVRMNEYGDITMLRSCRPGSPTVSVALMRQRIFYRSARK